MAADILVGDTSISPKQYLHPLELADGMLASAQKDRQFTTFGGGQLWLEDRGTKPVIPNKSNRKQPFSFDRKSYKHRRRIENALCRIKNFRRIATRYYRLARNYQTSVCLLAAIVWWI